MSFCWDLVENLTLQGESTEEVNIRLVRAMNTPAIDND